MILTKEAFTVDQVKEAKREMNEKIKALIIQYANNYSITELEVKVFISKGDIRLSAANVLVETKVNI
jgi:hypothetical protein